VRQAQPPRATGPGPAGVSLGPPFVTALIASRGTPGAHPPAGTGLHTLLGSPLPAPGHDGLVAGPLASTQAITWLCGPVTHVRPPSDRTPGVLASVQVEPEAKSNGVWFRLYLLFSAVTLPVMLS